MTSIPPREVVTYSKNTQTPIPDEGPDTEGELIRYRSCKFNVMTFEMMSSTSRGEFQERSVESV